VNAPAAYTADWPTSFWITALSVTMRNGRIVHQRENQMQPSPTVIMTGSERRSTFHSVSAGARLIGFGRNTLTRAMHLGLVPYRIVDERPVIEETNLLLFKQKLLDLARAEGWSPPAELLPGSTDEEVLAWRRRNLIASESGEVK
jgi:hypothetical protein